MDESYDNTLPKKEPKYNILLLELLILSEVLHKYFRFSYHYINGGNPKNFN